MTDVVIRFDTEDFVRPDGAEGILRSARILRKHGIRGSYVLVGKLAEALEKWGRDDIIEELKYHELSTHSYSHSVHPTMNEETDIEDFEEAKQRFFNHENKARDIITHIFGETEYSTACPPGYDISYVNFYGYAEMGTKISSDIVLNDRYRNRVMHFCNMACVNMVYPVDNPLMTATHEEILATLDEIAKTKDAGVVYHHPDKGIFKQHWDVLNFRGENSPEEKWVEGDRKTPEEVEKFYENFEFLVKALKDDPRFNIVTHCELATKYETERVITKKEIEEIAPQLKEKFFPVTTPDSYCLTDIFYACRALLLGEKEHKCGWVWGFLNPPYSITQPVKVTAEEMRESAKEIKKDYFLPEKITVGDKVLGTADWLRAAIEIILGAESAVVVPDVWQIDLDQFPALRDLKYDTRLWPIFSPELKDDYLSNRERLQSWTIRLPKNTKRLAEK